MTILRESSGHSACRSGWAIQSAAAQANKVLAELVRDLSAFSVSPKHTFYASFCPADFENTSILKTMLTAGILLYTKKKPGRLSQKPAQTLFRGHQVRPAIHPRQCLNYKIVTSLPRSQLSLPLQHGLALCSTFLNSIDPEGSWEHPSSIIIPMSHHQTYVCCTSLAVEELHLVAKTCSKTFETDANTAVPRTCCFRHLATS